MALLVGVATVDRAAAAKSDSVLYRPPAAWIAEPPALAPAPAASDTPVRVGYVDNQVRIAADGTEEAYTAYRVTVLKPEGLPAGNVTVAWQPDAGDLTVHRVQRIRGGVTTDVLAGTKFTILQREAQLDQSVLSGQRTATLQVPGLAVGDELVFAATIRRREAAFGGRVAGFLQLPVMGSPGTFRYRLLWPETRELLLRASTDMATPAPTVVAGEKRLELTLANPAGATPTEGAPPRFNVRRLVEYSDFGGWEAVSRRIAPLFDRAATLPASSPVKAEAAAIAGRSIDPAERARAALQLVEERIRYVYVGLNGANYMPASADETWRRRFGDCKAKAVLLVALLRELGIAAEAALVNSNGGDGLDARLPGPRNFDHVIVRAVVNGKVTWLDGTRLGDRYLDNLPQPFRWALPLTTAGAALEGIQPRDNGYPLMIGLADIDARAGVDKDAHARLRHIMRGDEAFAIRTQLASLSPEDADRALKSYWRQQADWITPDKVAWTYDERRMAISLDVQGEGNPGWKGDAAEGHNLTITGAGFYPPDTMRRPRDQDQAAGWSVPFPRFRCWATTIRLPEAAPKFHWSLYAEPMNRKLGGVSYWRASGLSRGTVRTVMSSHSYEAEASPEEAAIVNRAIPGFNNNMSSISEAAGAEPAAAGRLPFGDDVDWVNAPAPCSPAG